MEIRTIEKNGVKIAVVNADEKLLYDTQSALDLMAAVRYETDSDRIAVYKEAVAEDFFILNTRLAGEILQKFSNYRCKLAIIGDYSKYTSKPLRDFIRESNGGYDIFFVATKEEAVERLGCV